MTTIPMRTVVEGDTLEFRLSTAGYEVDKTYIIDVQVKHPDGKVTSDQRAIKIIAPVTRKAKK